MADDNVLLRLDRLEARAAIENLMGWYQHYFSLRDTDSILEKLWAEDTCAITLEDRFYGVYEGREGAFPDGGMRTYYASVMGFGSPADRPGKLMSYAMTTQTLEIAADAPTADESYKKGVTMTLDKCREAFGKMGVSEIEAQGKPFDPELHAAVLQQPSTDDMPSGTVTQVMQKGYLLHDKVIRHAAVAVAE